MSVPWITATPNLQTSIKIINSIDAVKFPLLLSRIYNAVQNNLDEPFDQQEIQKLEKSLKLSNQHINMLLENLLYITKKSKYFLMKPTVLQEELVEKLHFDIDKAEVFVKFWTENLKYDLDDFQNTTKLQNFAWELNIEAANDKDLKTANPTSTLQFQVKDNDEMKNITVEMNKEELLNLYHQIEDIQNTLDIINK